MKKSIIILVLALISLALSPVTSMAAGGTISLDKAVYSPNETIIVTVEGITQQMADDEAYVSIYKEGAGHGEYWAWWRPDVGTSQLEFEAPSEPGSYEMRLYNKDHVYTDETFVMSVPFKVVLQKQGKISLEKNAYQANTDISVTVSDITEEMEKAEAYVAIHKKSSKHNEWSSWTYVQAGDSVVVLRAPNQNGEFEMRLYSIDHNYTDESFVMSVPFTLSGAEESITSSWAETTIEKAEQYGLIPDSLKGADLTKPITRKEFAAVCVKLYERLSGKFATPAAKNPFTDTKDTEVLKAYNVDITSGIATDKFGPDIILNREQAATMLTRVFKKVFVPGWTLKEDSKYTFNYTMPPKFADDAKISDWAKPSVYFMVSHKIISGVGNNTFAPRATTTSEEATGYASATREQALAISLRIVENLGDGSAVSEIVAPPTGPVNQGNIANELVGIWFDNDSTGSIGYFVFLEFKQDGTFDKGLGAISGYTRSVQGVKGKYTIKGNKLLLTEQFGSKSKTATETDKNHWALTLSQDLVKDIPMEDEEFQISISDDKLTLVKGNVTIIYRRFSE